MDASRAKAYESESQSPVDPEALTRQQLLGLVSDLRGSVEQLELEIRELRQTQDRPSEVRGPREQVQAPRADTCEARPPKAPVPTSPARRVLIVDDEPDVLGVAEAVLEMAGFEVVCDGNGRSAVETVAEDPLAIDAAVLDMAMPVMDGKAVLQELRRLRPGLPVVMCSGFDRDDLVRRLGDLRPDGFVHKPFTVDGLVEAVEGVLSARDRL